MKELEKKIEAILLFKNEPVDLATLSKLLGEPRAEIEKAVSSLQDKYKDSGIVIVASGEEVSLGTHPDASELIERMQKEELSRELGRAGLETLAIILYRGPVSRREIDNVRGVNSSYIVRNLLVRGLIERGEQTPMASEAGRGGRGFSYTPTLELLRYLGVTKREDLPRFKEAFAKVEEFVKTSEADTDADK